MNKSFHAMRPMRNLFIGLLIALIAVGTATAAGPYGVVTRVRSGGSSTGGSYAMVAAIGQPITGLVQGGGYTVCTGQGCVLPLLSTPTSATSTPVPATETPVAQPSDTPTPTLAASATTSVTTTPLPIPTGTPTVLTTSNPPTPAQTSTQAPLETPTATRGTETPVPQSADPAPSIYLPLVLR